MGTVVEEDGDDGLLAMSAGQRERLVVVRAVGEGRLKQSAAAQRLGASVRQVRRLVRAWRGAGAAGLVSKCRGRPSARRIDEQTKQSWIDLVRQRCVDFGPTLACEHLVEHHGFAHSRETLRGWLIESGLWTPGARAASSTNSKPHSSRRGHSLRGATHLPIWLVRPQYR